MRNGCRSRSQSFDAIICECAFCTFPDKPAAADEFARVLRGGGQVGLSDLTRGPVLPKELDGMLAWIACIADAQPVETYVQYLYAAGFRVEATELHDEALVGDGEPDTDETSGRRDHGRAEEARLAGRRFVDSEADGPGGPTAIQQGSLGYAVICASKD